jgi:hypothetical protein
MNRLIRQAWEIALPLAPENFQALRSTEERVYGHCMPLEYSSAGAAEGSDPVDDLLRFVKIAMRYKTF